MKKSPGTDSILASPIVFGSHLGRLNQLNLPFLVFCSYLFVPVLYTLSDQVFKCLVGFLLRIHIIVGGSCVDQNRFRFHLWFASSNHTEIVNHGCISFFRWIRSSHFLRLYKYPLISFISIFFFGCHFVENIRAKKKSELEKNLVERKKKVKWKSRGIRFSRECKLSVNNRGLN